MAYPEMTVKHGKFYKGNQEVPIEHGNKEQIALLHKVEEMRTEGFYPEMAIKQIICMQFTCVCGAINEFDSFSELDIDDQPRFIKGETDKCHCCGLEYIVTVDEQDDLMLKIKTNKK